MTTEPEFLNAQRARELFGAVGGTKRFDLIPLGLPFSEHADGFKRAGDVLVERARNERNSLVYPVCYLYRHCLELWIKHLIVLASDYLNSDLFGKKFGRHSFPELWQICRSGLEEAMPEWPKASFDEIGECLKALASLDGDGEVFRYPVNMKGERWQLRLRSIDLGKMRETISTVVDKLENHSLEINHRIDTHDWGRP